jgi:hypothetical protein
MPSREVEDLPGFHPMSMTYEETSLIEEAQRQWKCKHTLQIVLTLISPASGEPVVHQNLQNWSAIIILSLCFIQTNPWLLDYWTDNTQQHCSDDALTQNLSIASGMEWSSPPLLRKVAWLFPTLTYKWGSWSHHNMEHKLQTASSYLWNCRKICTMTIWR